MSLTGPIPWKEALQYAGSRKVMPTSMGSAALKGIPAQLRERALFSARTTNADYLQEVGDEIQRLLKGETNEATSRANLQGMLDGMGYDPTVGGFQGESPAPDAPRNSLRDISSDKRIKLVLETNLRQAANHAYREAGLSEDAVWQFPAWELVRIYQRTVPRGFTRGKGGVLVPAIGESWQERWVRSGGKLYGDRMIAAKGDAVWNTLGDSGVFDDGLDTPYPPFAFNSGFGIREVPRSECRELGVPLEAGEPERTGLNDELKVEAERFDDDFLAVLSRDLRTEAGQLRVQNRESEAERVANRCLRVLEVLCNGRPDQARDSLGMWVDENGGGLSPHDNLKRGQRAMQMAILHKRDVPKAMHRKEVGQIDFIWGTPGNKKPDAKGVTHVGGYGISHVLSKHPNDAPHVPEVLAVGKIIQHEHPDKKYVVHGTRLVVLKRKNKSKSYVLTGLTDLKRTSDQEKSSRPTWLSGR